jgi:hypothetical protein
MLRAVAYVKEMLVAPSGDPLSPAEKLVALVLADYFNAELGYAFPSMERLAAESLVGDRHCRRIVKALEEKGVLAIETGGGRYANRYRFPQLDGVALPPVADPEPVPAAGHAAVEERLTVTEVADGLREVIDGLLSDLDDDPVQAYMEGLRVAQDLAVEYADLSKDAAKFLRNVVIAHAAERVHGDLIEGAELPRLYRAATTLGAEGARWVIWALWQTATASIKGNVASYVIKVAQSGKAAWKGAGHV